jgi:hypothetical protein
MVIGVEYLPKVRRRAKIDFFDEGSKINPSRRGCAK